LGLLITVYGVSMLVGQASVVAMLNPYISYMVVVGAVFAVLEGTTKI